MLIICVCIVLKFSRELISIYPVADYPVAEFPARWFSKTIIMCGMDLTHIDYKFLITYRKWYRCLESLLWSLFWLFS
ncbi:hypothetical protein PHOSAC3_90289 [Mesotoga infera]|nr:hypothetical protein PHOSAC3_90289 [Mesotoga infera]